MSNLQMRVLAGSRISHIAHIYHDSSDYFILFRCENVFLAGAAVPRRGRARLDDCFLDIGDGLAFPPFDGSPASALAGSVHFVAVRVPCGSLSSSPQRRECRYGCSDDHNVALRYGPDMEHT